MRHAQKMDAIGHLTGGVAHDFNNILTVITGTIGILEEAVADQPEYANIAKLIEEAAERGANLTRHLLAFARKQPLQPVEFDVNALALEAIKLLHPTLGEHIEITPLLAEDAWTAVADPSQLTTAVLNLAINARDAMPNGGKLAIETANVFLDENYASMNSEVTPGHYVMIAVSDTGTGIPPALLERVFEPFFTTKEVGRGTGLGLSMVFGFVKQSGGHVNIYSEEGHGTSVKIYLPRATGLQPSAAEARVSANIEGGTETILVVEDDAMVRRYVMTQIQSLGYATLEAANAPDALRIIDDVARHRPAVHRRDHARRHERPPARRRSAEAAARPQDALYVGLHGERHRPSRPAGFRRAAAGEALPQIRTRQDDPAGACQLSIPLAADISVESGPVQMRPNGTAR